MINLIVQADSQETIQDLKKFIEAYCNGSKIEVNAYEDKLRNHKYKNLTSKKACVTIDIQELSADALLEKIDQDDLEKIWADLSNKGFFC